MAGYRTSTVGYRTKYGYLPLGVYRISNRCPFEQYLSSSFFRNTMIFYRHVARAKRMDTWLRLTFIRRRYPASAQSINNSESEIYLHRTLIVSISSCSTNTKVSYTSFNHVKILPLTCDIWDLAGPTGWSQQNDYIRAQVRS